MNISELWKRHEKKGTREELLMTSRRQQPIKISFQFPPQDDDYLQDQEELRFGFAPDYEYNED